MSEWAPLCAVSWCRVATLAVALGMAAGCAAVGRPASTASGETGSDVVEVGDLVRVRYTVRRADHTGAVVADSSHGWLAPPDSTDPRVDPEGVGGGDPEVMLAGSEARFPGIGDGVVGMAVGERRVIDLPAARAFGIRKPADVTRLPREQLFPGSMVVPAYTFRRQFGGEPTPGREVEVLPSIQGRVIAVDDGGVTLRLLAVEGAVVKRPFGTSVVHHDAKGIRVRFNPILGSEIPIGGRTGYIVAADEKQVTVDFNHPHAGEDYRLEIEVVAVTKPAIFGGWTIPWIEDHDRGLGIAAESDRPLVLILYADWCPHCRRLFREVLTDPRITELRDRFVWVKVNSDLHTSYKRRYNQSGYPLIVVMDSDGQVVRRLDGFRGARRLRAELEATHLLVRDDRQTAAAQGNSGPPSRGGRL